VIPDPNPNLTDAQVTAALAVLAYLPRWHNSSVPDLFATLFQRIKTMSVTISNLSADVAALAASLNADLAVIAAEIVKLQSGGTTTLTAADQASLNSVDATVKNMQAELAAFVLPATGPTGATGP